MKIILTLLLIATATLASEFDHLPFFEYCRAKDYPVEDHLIPTQDHYNLRFYRLQAKNTEITEGKKVIYLQHGLTDSSDTWVVNEQHLAPAFIFANQGYDVWVGNSRGNRYSNKHLSPTPLNFWDFSFDQMAKYDLPAAFEYIKRVTGQKMHYVGHSQGTLIMFIALSLEIPSVRDNLLSFHALGPVAFLTHVTSKAMKIMAKDDVATIMMKSQIKEVFLEGKDGLRGNSLVCRYTPIVCAELLLAISDSNLTVNNMKRMPVIMGHFPSGSSTKNFVHFQQYIKRQHFCAYDYGEKKNMIVYGQKTAPAYDLSKISIPVHLYVGKYDKLADVQDAKILFDKLNNSPNKTMKVYNFGHATFIWGKSIEHVNDITARIEALSQE